MMHTVSADLERAIVKTVAYVDGFDFPLTVSEIHRYLPYHHATYSDVLYTLEHSPRLQTALDRRGDYIMLSGRGGLATLRQERQILANSAWPEAIAFGAQFAQLPFARMVAVTGSLAVDNITPGFDIDFLIITEPGYVWLCRAFAIALVRVAQLRHVDLCPNYFLSKETLTFTERNLYTAHEVTQMVPLHGHDMYAELRQQNQWTNHFLPNATGAPGPNGFLASRQTDLNPVWNRVQQASEYIMRSPLGRRLERWEMDRKIRKFREQGSWQESAFTSSCCKGHFHDHQRRAITAYEARLAEDVS